MIEGTFGRLTNVAGMIIHNPPAFLGNQLLINLANDSNFKDGYLYRLESVRFTLNPEAATTPQLTWEFYFSSQFPNPTWAIKDPVGNNTLSPGTNYFMGVSWHPVGGNFDMSLVTGYHVRKYAIPQLWFSKLGGRITATCSPGTAHSYSLISAVFTEYQLEKHIKTFRDERSQ